MLCIFLGYASVFIISLLILDVLLTFFSFVSMEMLAFKATDFCLKCFLSSMRCLHRVFVLLPVRDAPPPTPSPEPCGPARALRRAGPPCVPGSDRADGHTSRQESQGSSWGGGLGATHQGHLSALLFSLFYLLLPLSGRTQLCVPQIPPVARVRARLPEGDARLREGRSRRRSRPRGIKRLLRGGKRGAAAEKGV